jgi:thymidine kinase
MAMADEVVQKYAFCSKCGQPAVRSQLIVDGKPVTKITNNSIVIGDKTYEPRCRSCFAKEVANYE